MGFEQADVGVKRSSRRSKPFPNCRAASKSHLGEAPEWHWKVPRSTLRFVVGGEARQRAALSEWWGILYSGWAVLAFIAI